MTELTAEQHAILEGFFGQHGIMVRPQLVRALKGDGNAAILLSQFVWTTLHNHGYPKTGGWFHNTREEIETITGLSHGVQRRVRAMLVKAGLLDETDKTQGRRLHFRVDTARVAELIVGQYAIQKHTPPPPKPRQMQGTATTSGEGAQMLELPPSGCADLEHLEGRSHDDSITKESTKPSTKASCSSAPQKIEAVDEALLLPSSELITPQPVKKTPIDPLTLERTLTGAYLFSLKDLRSFSAAHEAAGELIQLDPELWQWLVDLRGNIPTKTFKTYPEDVLTHVATYGAERVKAALKYTVQKPNLSYPWNFYLDRVARDVETPASSGKSASSKKFSGAAADDAGRYTEPYPGAWDMANLLATAPLTGQWGRAR